jgi:hypothetical protein
MLSSSPARRLTLKIVQKTQLGSVSRPVVIFIPNMVPRAVNGRKTGSRRNKPRFQHRRYQAF